MSKEEDLKNPLIEIEQQEIKRKNQPVSFLSLFKYADKRDKLYMFIGSIGAALGGAVTPFFMIFFSQISLIFIESNRANAEAEGLTVALKFFILGGAAWFLNFLGLYCWNTTGSRQALRFKKMYYQTILEQEVAWYDSNDTNKLATEISGNMVAVESAIGEKISILLTTLVTSTFGFFYAYFKCWQLSLVLTALLPLLLFAGVLMMKSMTMNAQKRKVSYEDAAGVAEQAFTGIKTVKALVSQSFEESKFVEGLSKSQNKVIKYTVLASASLGVMSLIFLGLYSLGFFYGKQLLIWFPQDYTAPTIISTFFCFLVGGASIGQISPIMKNIAQGKVAAAQLYALIDREKSLIEPINGVKVNTVDIISLKGIKFKYEKVNIEKQTNPKQQQSKQNLTEKGQEGEQKQNINKDLGYVLDDVSLLFPKGKVTAIVGESGSGKSTIVQILMRYYDVTQGGVFVNGLNIKDIDIKGFRKQVGFVGQEPVLFSMSLAQNIQLSNPDLTDSQIQEILKKANAWEFVSKMTEGMHTYVGTGGTQISGGQKQRVAIARAIAKKPNVLILDQATSALDRKNQKQIQKTLNNLSQGNMTTVVIAHRLSTIKNADNIVVLSKGKVVQEGKHQQLYQNKGSYYELIKSQMAAQQINSENMKEDIHINKQQQQSKIVVSEATQADEEQKKQQKEEQKHTKEQLDAVFGKIFKQCKQNICLLLLGAFAALANGAVWPGFNIAFSNIIALMADAENKSSQINDYCLLFLLTAVGGGLATFGYQFCFGIVGQKLVFRLRKKIFKKLIKMPVSYYDKPENSPGGISTKLSQDTYQIHNMVTGIISVICLNVSTVTVSMIIAFVHSWKLTLIVLGLSPLIAISGSINMALVKSMTQKAEKFEKQIGNLISDTVTNIRTVKSFGNQRTFQEKFGNKIDSLYNISEKKTLRSSILQGMARGSIMFIEGLTFYIAGILYTNYQIDNSQSIYIAIFSVIFAAMGVGQNSQFMPDMGKAKHAGANIFQILQSQDEYEIATQNQKISVAQTLKQMDGDIEFKNVVFKYPQRDTIILNNFNLKVAKGQKIGFVGSSGSGKSTIAQLLMRFYPLQQGKITFNGHNIEDFNLQSYRKNIGMVSQEPSLFLGTVKDNILYNYNDVKSSALSQSNSNKKLKKYTQISHAYKFINEWDQKFEKEVGQKGSQVSGGQKQRIALSRCLIRKPKIFILDQFTSALDADTQKIVFENMKPELKAKTSISIAHRLCTIEDADRIIMMRDGHIIEEGSYEQLMNKKENFYRLAKGIS